MSDQLSYAGRAPFMYGNPPRGYDSQEDALRQFHDRAIEAEANADKLARRLKWAIVHLCRQGQSRCGSGFGKYPLGLWDAVEHLSELLPKDEDAKSAIRAFKERLDRP